MRKRVIGILCILTYCVSFLGCTNVTVTPPKSTMTLNIITPLWISGTITNKLLYTRNLPYRKENGHLTVTNAGFWLGNNHNNASQLTYAFDLAVKKPFSCKTIYTRAILENPSNPDNPIIYENSFKQTTKSIKIKHTSLTQIKMDKTYRLIFEVYSDVERQNLITKINQPITAVVDNTNECVKVSDAYMSQILETIIDQNGPTIPIDKLIIKCHK